jgi:hypothetical protein
MAHMNAQTKQMPKAIFAPSAAHSQTHILSNVHFLFIVHDFSLSLSLLICLFIMHCDYVNNWRETTSIRRCMSDNITQLLTV